jgi:hypothetical protein
MIEQIATAPMEVALLGAFTLILLDLVRGRRRGSVRVMAVVVGAPACALAATMISAGLGWAVAATLEPGQQPPTRTEQTTPECVEGEFCELRVDGVLGSSPVERACAALRLLASYLSVGRV